MECECHCLLWYPLGLLTTGPDQPLGPPPWPRPIAFTSNVVFGGQACKPGPRLPTENPGGSTCLPTPQAHTKLGV